MQAVGTSHAGGEPNATRTHHSAVAGLDDATLALLRAAFASYSTELPITPRSFALPVLELSPAREQVADARESARVIIPKERDASARGAHASVLRARNASLDLDLASEVRPLAASPSPSRPHTRPPSRGGSPLGRARGGVWSGALTAADSASACSSPREDSGVDASARASPCPDVRAATPSTLSASPSAGTPTLHRPVPTPRASESGDGTALPALLRLYTVHAARAPILSASSAKASEGKGPKLPSALQRVRSLSEQQAAAPPTLPPSAIAALRRGRAAEELAWAGGRKGGGTSRHVRAIRAALQRSHTADALTLQQAAARAAAAGSGRVEGEEALHPLLRLPSGPPSAFTPPAHAPGVGPNPLRPTRLSLVPHGWGREGGGRGQGGALKRFYSASDIGGPLHSIRAWRSGSRSGSFSSASEVGEMSIEGPATPPPGKGVQHSGSVSAAASPVWEPATDPFGMRGSWHRKERTRRSWGGPTDSPTTPPRGPLLSAPPSPTLHFAPGPRSVEHMSSAASTQAVHASGGGGVEGECTHSAASSVDGRSRTGSASSAASVTSGALPLASTVGPSSSSPRESSPRAAGRAAQRLAGVSAPPLTISLRRSTSGISPSPLRRSLTAQGAASPSSLPIPSPRLAVGTYPGCVPDIEALQSALLASASTVVPEGSSGGAAAGVGALMTVSESDSECEAPGPSDPSPRSPAGISWPDFAAFAASWVASDPTLNLRVPTKHQLRQAFDAGVASQGVGGRAMAAGGGRPTPAGWTPPPRLCMDTFLRACGELQRELLRPA
jgi:hypothetical protein